MHPLDPRKIRERLRLYFRQRKTRLAAYESARELCAAVGSKAIAREYCIICPNPDCVTCQHYAERMPLAEVAAGYARTAHHPTVFEAARDGALAGFAEYGRRRVEIAGSARHHR